MILEALKKYKVYLIVTLIVLVGIIVFINIWNILVFRVVTTIPGNNQKINTGTNLITIEYNKPILVPTESDIVSESNIIREIKVNNNKLEIYINNTSNDRNYQIIIKSVKSQDDQVINNYVYSFKTGYVPENEMSEREKEQAIQQNDRGNTEDPIISVLPYSTPSYRVTYQFRVVGEEKTQIYIVANIYLNEVDKRAGVGVSTEFYKKQINDYLVSKGINPKDYQIEYIVR